MSKYPTCFYCNNNITTLPQFILLTDNSQKTIHKKCIAELIEKYMKDALNPMISKQEKENYMTMEIEDIAPIIIENFNKLIVKQKFNDPQFDNIKSGINVLFGVIHATIVEYLMDTKIVEFGWKPYSSDYYVVLKNPTPERTKILKNLVKELREITKAKFEFLFKSNIKF